MLTLQVALLLLLGTLAGRLPMEDRRQPMEIGTTQDRLRGEYVPVVVPVARGAIPYSLQVVWTVFSAGDTTSQVFREKYLGRACENSPFFLRRESGRYDPCRALDLVPWLTITRGVPDSSIAKAAVMFADSMTDLSRYVDPGGEINAIVVALVGYGGPPHHLALNYRARQSQRPVIIRSAAIVGLPSDSSLVTEKPLVLAMPYVVGLPPTTLVEDEAGQVHLHPEARLRLWPDSLEVVTGPRTLRIDTEVHSCGSLACIVASPTYRVEAGQEVVYIVARYDEGVLLEAVRPFNAEADTPSVRIAPIRRVIATPEGRDVSFAFPSTTSESPQPAIVVSWRGHIAEVEIPPQAK